MKTRIIFIFIVLTLALFTTILFGCSFDRWVEVADGDYIPIDAGMAHSEVGIEQIKSMTVDRNNNTIKIMLKNGSEVTESFIARPENKCPLGCPANLGSTRMEVLEIDTSDLTIGSIVFSNPVLVRNCPSEPELVLLREDGQIGGSGTACAGNNKCIHFKPGFPAGPMQSPRELTEEEKDLVINTALDSPEVMAFLEEGGSFKTEPKWIARLDEESGASVSWQIDYDWQADNRYKNVPEAAIWYPAVLIRFGEPAQQQMLVAIDLDTERVVQTHKTPSQTGVPGPAEDRLPDITGWITDVQVSTGGDISGQILVELDESDGTSDKYWISIKKDVQINDYRKGTHDILAFTDLETGQQVQVWFDGPVRESYPAQADAAQIDLVLNEEFAIYFLDKSILPYEMPALSHVNLPESPTISITDIISYSMMTHEIELVPEAYERIQNMEVARVFVVAVARKPVYWGIFWSPAMSSSLDSVVILKPLSSDRQVIQIQLGYPSQIAFTGDDPRSSPVIMKSLERTGKLGTVIGQHVPIEEVEKAD